MLEQAQRPHELTVVPRSHLPHLRRAEIPRPASPAIMALLIPNAHEVCAEFLDGVGGLAWLDGFRVVRDEQGLFGFDYDDAFSALYRHSNTIVSTPVAFAFAFAFAFALVYALADSARGSYLFPIDAAVVRLQHKVLLPCDPDPVHLHFLRLRVVSERFDDGTHLLRRYLERGGCGPDAVAVGVEDRCFVDVAGADEAVWGSVRWG